VVGKPYQVEYEKSIAVEANAPSAAPNATRWSQPPKVAPEAASRKARNSPPTTSLIASLASAPLIVNSCPAGVSASRPRGCVRHASVIFASSSYHGNT